ncbi:MAG: peptidoglycan D,D-transpeptidase FtsI family protein [Pirellulales bacterium]
MPRPDRHFDWHRVLPAADDDAAVIDSRARLSWWPIVVALALVVVWLRMAWLEQRDGPAYRELAARPIERVEILPAPRGRILTRDGTVLAEDEQRLALAVAYRWLEEPPQAQWLRSQARSRLDSTERRDAGRVAHEVQRLCDERNRLHADLAALCGMSGDQWREAVAEVQARVEATHRAVNAARRRAHEAQWGAADASADATSPGSSLGDRWRRLLFPPDDRQTPPEIAVAEELDHHVVFEGLSLAGAAAIQSRPDAYPGARVVQLPHRHYPQATLAAHLVGHLGAARSATSEVDGAASSLVSSRVGVMGIERQLEASLRGVPGEEVELLDRAGAVLASYRRAEPQRGRDVVLSINAQLQASCEQLIERALARRPTTAGAPFAPGGGAIVVLEAHSGALLAAASGPRFSPEGFTHGDRTSVEQALGDPARPLVDRTCRMALPPGSVFKVLSTLALLDSGQIRPHTVLACQGFWRQPDELRCAVYRRHGRGHGEVDLADALACGCNVYFFEHAASCGLDPLIDWGARFGFGQQTGVDLPDEAAGQIPASVSAAEVSQSADTQTAAQLLAIGQGKLAATPLQVARAMAAIANGGQLVTPYVVSTLGVAESAPSRAGAESDNRGRDGDIADDEFAELLVRAPQKIAGLDERHLQVVREALRRVVDDADGSAGHALADAPTSIAGIVGTAQVGAGLADHAWFAGYAPAEAPRVVIVVALEHAGEGSVAASPVARLVVERLAELGILRPVER